MKLIAWGKRINGKWTIFQDDEIERAERKKIAHRAFLEDDQAYWQEKIAWAKYKYKRAVVEYLNQCKN